MKPPPPASLLQAKAVGTLFNECEHSASCFNKPRIFEKNTIPQQEEVSRVLLSILLLQILNLGALLIFII
jgi:hypothetical protein